MSETGDPNWRVGAFSLLEEAESYIPGDALLEAWRSRICGRVPIRTDPPGATVSYKAYSNIDGPWKELGQTPLEDVRIPMGWFRWRIEKPGYESRDVARYMPRVSIEERRGPLWAANDSSLMLDFELDREGSIPEGMVPVEGGTYSTLPLVGLPFFVPTEIGRFLIDRTEVTNREFKQFVDSGGYERPEFWKQPFVREGQELSFDEAMVVFRDATGRQGPSTWELGDYQSGTGDHPVAGVSWYEGAAYCESQGKSLPTVAHWVRAALPSLEISVPVSLSVIALSNFGGTGPEPVASHQGIGVSGAHDMAGNVREWCWNASGDRRFSLGGAWSDPEYSFPGAFWRNPPWDRLPTNGFRCVKYLEDGPGEGLTDPIELPTHDFYNIPEMPEEGFLSIKRLHYLKDPSPLNVVVEREGESPLGGKEVLVTIDASYGQERLPIRLHLPQHVEPPYQAIVWHWGAGTLKIKSIKERDGSLVQRVGPLFKSGRAVVQPIYAGTCERNDGNTFARFQSPSARSELFIRWGQDLIRTLDYLESRDDIDATKIAYLGNSQGAWIAPFILPFEDRVRTALLWNGGFALQASPEEAYQLVNFSRRLTIPVLMLNGRYDYVFPLESCQKPMFDLLGTPPEHKQHVVLDVGHGAFPRADLIRENVEWLDKYLGPVKRAAP
jgi:predicted esterase